MIDHLIYHLVLELIRCREIPKSSKWNTILNKGRVLNYEKIEQYKEIIERSEQLIKDAEEISKDVFDSLGEDIWLTPLEKDKIINQKITEKTSDRMLNKFAKLLTMQLIRRRMASEILDTQKLTQQEHNVESANSAFEDLFSLQSICGERIMAGTRDKVGYTT